MGLHTGPFMRLNVGCGRHVLDGWTNVDVVASPRAKRPPEVLSDARSIPLADGCAQELQAIHLLEHFYRWEVPAVLAEWRRLLCDGGRLVLELPNLQRCVENIVEGLRTNDQPLDQLGMWGLYGDPREEDPYMCHKWAWTPATLRAELKLAGFGKIRETPTQWHSAGRLRRDMRLEAVKC